MTSSFSNQLADIIENHLSDPTFGINDLTRELGMSRSKIYRKLKAENGKSVNEVIREIRMLKAYEMLKDDNITAAEVSYRVGFSSPSYFNKCFVEYFDINPGQVKNVVSNTVRPVNKPTFFITRRAYPWNVIVIVLVSLILYFSIQSGQKPIHQSVIAVFPFKNLGADPEGIYFSDGLQEELLTQLSKIKELKVKSRTAVEPFKNNAPSRDQILKELQLTHYIEGSAHKIGNQVKLTIQLIDAQSENHLWAETFEFDYIDIWKIQNNIAKRVTQVLQIDFDTSEIELERPTDNLEAWDLYLLARYNWHLFLANEEFDYLSEMVNHLKRAILLDPNFSRAYVSLAMAYQKGSNMDLGTIPEFVKADSVVDLLNTAIALDPKLAAAYFIRADHYARIDTSKARMDYEKAIQLEPGNAEGLWKFALFHFYQRQDVPGSLKYTYEALKEESHKDLKGRLLAFLGENYWCIEDFEKAKYFFERATAYQPDNLSILRRKAYVHLISGELELVRQSAQRMKQIFEGDAGMLELATYHIRLEEFEKARELMEVHYAKGAQRLVEYWYYTLLMTGDEDKAWQGLEELIRTKSHDHYLMAKIYALKGSYDSTYFYLQSVIDGDEIWPISTIMKEDQFMAEMRYEQEFIDLVYQAEQKIGAVRNQVKLLENSGIIPRDLREFEEQWLRQYLMSM